MPLFSSRPASLLLAIALVLPAAQASAQNAGGRDAGRGGAERAERAPRAEDRHNRGEDHRELSDAVRRVERRTGGQVLSAERVPFDGRNVNRVKVVDSSGRVRVYMDDPQTQDRRKPEQQGDDD